MLILHRCKQKMHVIGHYDDGVELDSLSVIMKAMLENNVACRRREGLATEFAEGYEYWLARFLVVRKIATVFIHAVESDMFGHRTPCGALRAVRVCDD